LRINHVAQAYLSLFIIEVTAGGANLSSFEIEIKHFWATKKKEKRKERKKENK